MPDTANRTNNTLCYRPATLTDASNIVALVHSAYRGETSRTGWTTEADILEGTRTDIQEVNEIINTPDNLIILCEQQNQILASVHLQKQGSTAYLGMFAVRPNLQNSGIGKAHLHTAEQIVQQQWQCPRMQMTVITLRHELIAWYIRRGYQPTGLFKPFPYGQSRYGNPKRDDLLLEVLEKTFTVTSSMLTLP
jgi:ribosomal protein S18 acetylase RimI-like enzyme